MGESTSAQDYGATGTVDHAGVLVHPPLFLASALLLGALIDDRLSRLVSGLIPLGVCTRVCRS